MEEHVWPTPEVKGYLKDDYVLISLYVDDKEGLPEEDQITVEYPGGKIKKLKTVGNKWEFIQAKYFNNNSQPYYVLLSPDGSLLNKPVAYTPDVDEYANFLKCGVEIFNEKNSLLGSK
jgi:thiol:disulfide interchange protein DsbD